MDKEICKNLYQKYQGLKEKTKLEAHRIEAGGKVEAQYISPQDLEELDKAVEELVSCLDFLTDDELIKISEDDIVGGKARETLRNRKR